MKILIIGGHPATALAVIDRLKPQDEVIYLGSKYVLNDNKSYSFEFKEITQRKIIFINFISNKYNRHSLFETLKTSYKLPLAIKNAKEIIKNHNPDIILSFGGYLSLPICIAGRMSGVPIVIHEQTFQSGLSNRLTSRFADIVCISWETSYKYFPKNKSIFTGLPLRQSILKIDRNKIENLIYITGGSLGSDFINQIVFENLEFLTGVANVIHQTGSHNNSYYFQRLTEKWKTIKNSTNNKYNVVRHVESGQLNDIYGRSRMVISRSGINTVAELMYLNIPSLFIPLTYGQKNEQLVNAENAYKQGICEILAQEKYSRGIFQNKVSNLFNNPKKYEIQVDKYNKLFSKAAYKIIDVLNETSKKTTQ